MRYDRTLMSTTLKAMKRINEIKQARERVFYKQRTLGQAAKEKGDMLREVKMGIELLDGPELVQKALEAKMGESSVKRMDMEEA